MAATLVFLVFLLVQVLAVGLVVFGIVRMVMRHGRRKAQRAAVAAGGSPATPVGLPRSGGPATDTAGTGR